MIEPYISNVNSMGDIRFFHKGFKLLFKFHPAPLSNRHIVTIIISFTENRVTRCHFWQHHLGTKVDHD